jgi:hypothetical protein
MRQEIIASLECSGSNACTNGSTVGAAWAKTEKPLFQD